MFPVRDDLSHSRTSFGVLAIVAACTAAFWHERGLPGPWLEAYVQSYGLIPARDWPAYGDVVVLPYLSSLFLHGGWLHLLANMWTLWIFGRGVEEALGTARFLVFYLLCGIGAMAAHAALNADSVVPVVGASGAIAGVMGAYLPLFPRARLRMVFLFVFYPVFFEIPALVFLVFWFFGQLFSGADALAGSGLGSGADAVAFWAHVGGFVAGLALLPFFSRD